MLYIIVNPASRSGRGARIWSEFESILKDSSIVYKAFKTKKGGIKTVEKELLSLVSKDKDRPVVCVLGGDGTVNETINVLTDVLAKIRLVYFPTGSSNDLARALDIQRDFSSFIEKYRKDDLPEKKADTGLLSFAEGKKRRFAVSCGIGYDASVCKEALDSKMKHTLNRIGLGKLTYVATAIKSLRKMPLSTAYITLDNGEELHFDRFIFAAAMIHKYEGGGIRFAPDADSNDGKIDLVVAAGISKPRILFLLPLAFFGLHKYSKSIHFYRTSSAEIRVDTPLTVHTDGEFAGMRTQINVSCIKDGLHYY